MVGLVGGCPPGITGLPGQSTGEKEIVMAKLLLALLLLVSCVATVGGCKASAEVDDDEAGVKIDT